MSTNPKFVPGGGDFGLLAQVGKVEQGFTLHVSNIPVGMDVDGLRHQFCPPGTTVKPLEVKVVAPKLPGAKTTWGFVSYATEEAAREAQGRLNGAPPFRLRIYPKKTDEERAKEAREAMEREREARLTMDKLEQFHKTAGVGVTVDNEAVPQLAGRTEKLQAVACSRDTGGKPSGIQGGAYPAKHEQGYTSGTATEAEEKDMNGNLANKGGLKPAAVASTAVFRHGAPISVRVRTPVLDCLYCGTEGRVRCSRCKSWYCSQRCQANHWPVHKPDCVPPPPLENPDGTVFVAPSLRLLRQDPDSPTRVRTSSSTLRQPVEAEAASQATGYTSLSASPQKPEARPLVTTAAKGTNAKPPAAAKESPAPKPSEVKPPAAKESPAPKPSEVKPPVAKQSPAPKPLGAIPPAAKPADAKESSQATNPASSPIQPAAQPPKPEQAAAPAPKPSEPSSIKKVGEPKAPPAAEVPDWIEAVDVAKWAVFSRTNLDGVAAGDVVSVVVNFDRKVTDAATSIVNTPASFAAFCIHEMEADAADIEEDPNSDLNVLLQGLDLLYKEKKAAGTLGIPDAARIPGQVVLVNEDEEEGNVSRCIIVEKESDTTAGVYGVDIPGKRSRAFDEMAVAPDRVRHIAGFGYRMTCAEAMTPSMASQIKALAADSILNFKVSAVRKFAAAGDGRLKKMNLVLLDGDDKPLIPYVAVPWFRAGDPRVQKILSVPSEHTFLSEFKSVKVEKSDTVMKIGFGEWADMLIVVRQSDLAAIGKVDQILNDAQLEALTEAPTPRQVVAVKTDTVKPEGAFHRAVVRAVNDKEGKARVRLIDHGATIIEPLSSLFEVPEDSLDDSLYPAFASLLPIHGVEGAVKMTEGPNQVMMKTLEPIFESGLTVSDVKEGGKHVLTHPNGKTVGQIISEKIAEPEEVKSRGQVQGMEAGGEFHYDKCSFAELRVEPGALQEVLVLHVASPQEIYVTPCDQLAQAVSTIMEQVRNYAAATEADFRGFRPNNNKMCVAKSADDGQWYRAACLAQEADTFTLFFADFGFVEEVVAANVLPVDPALMKAPLLANHCIMEGFEEDGGDEAGPDEDATAAIQELLPPNEVAKVEIAKKSPDGVYVISMPEITEALQGTEEPAPAPAPEVAAVAPEVAPPAVQQAAPEPTPAPPQPLAANNAAMLAIQEQMLALQRQLAALQQ